MIFDFKTGEEIELVIDKDQALSVKDAGDCAHYHPIVVDEVARTANCRHCGQMVDIFTVVMRLYRHYETRIDQRLVQIREFDEREERKRAARIANKKQTRERLAERRRESLERAAYNEYQAKLLTIRAGKQRLVAEKCDKAILGIERGTGGNS